MIAMAIIFIVTIVSWEEKIGQVLFLCDFGLVFVFIFGKPGNTQRLHWARAHIHTHQILKKIYRYVIET